MNACDAHQVVLMLRPSGETMSAHCAICGKQRIVANNISHSNIKTKSLQRANLQRVHITVGGGRKHVRVCTRCLRSGFVNKAGTV
jgi:large subunit ribosomal protein L28